jgi:hypothetical protein
MASTQSPDQSIEKTENKANVQRVETINVSNESDDASESESNRMNATKWLACIALGMSYTTALQQQACTASIVRHIDIELGPTSYYNW